MLSKMLLRNTCASCGKINRFVCDCAGVLDERVACALDWVVAAAMARGLRLVLVLSNYWHEYGGLPQYVR